MKKVMLMTLGVGLVLVVVGSFISLKQESNPVATQEQNVTAADQVVSQSNTASKEIPIPDLAIIQRPKETPNADDYVREMIARIKQEFANTIHLVAVQVSLKEFRDDLIRGYPQQGASMFEQILRAAFPELADQILAAIALMDSYDQWLLDAMLDLNQMDLLAQQNALWDKRYELFGDDAKTIWTEELSAEEEREHSVKSTVAMLDQAYDMPIDERLYLLQNAFNENYSQSMSELILDTTSVMTQVFFRFDSVQRELRELPDEERQLQIDEIRRKIGYSEEQIASMAEQDQKKEARWRNGYAYMEARQALEAEALPAEQFSQRLADLRTDHFGDEAYTIGKEEEELGFFRYERPRVYGWN